MKNFDLITQMASEGASFENKMVIDNCLHQVAKVKQISEDLAVFKSFKDGKFYVGQLDPTRDIYESLECEGHKNIDDALGKAGKIWVDNSTNSFLNVEDVEMEEWMDKEILENMGEEDTVH
ncbi:hypothetical protein HOD29_05050 [archaeon]|jgi:hypothetical protein|nr:hypothetical protein [archaeon]